LERIEILMTNKPPELAKIIEICLEAMEDGTWDLADCLTEYPEYQAELEVMLPIGLELRKARSMRISDEFRSAAPDRMKERLLVSGRPPRSDLVTNPPTLRSILRTRNPFRQRRVGSMPALVSILLALALLVTGTVTGADAAGPGDLLYGVDRAVEDVRLWLTSDDEAEVELHLEFAAERLEEAEIEIEAEGDGAEIEEALAAFDKALAALLPLLDNLSPEQQALLAETIELLRASRAAIEEIELSIEIEDGVVEIEVEAEFEGEHLDDDDHDLDDDDDEAEDDPDCDVADLDDNDDSSDHDNLDDDCEAGHEHDETEDDFDCEVDELEDDDSSDHEDDHDDEEEDEDDCEADHDDDADEEDEDDEDED
jgi:hypothetical protein